MSVNIFFSTRGGAQISIGWGKILALAPRAAGPRGCCLQRQGRGAEPPENFWLPHPKILGWGRILDPLYWKE